MPPRKHIGSYSKLLPQVHSRACHSYQTVSTFNKTKRGNMGATDEVVSLLMQMSDELTQLKAAWDTHMALVSARRFNSPEKPFLKPSTTIEKGLTYLNSEVSDINLRSYTVRWGSQDEDDNASQFSLPELLIRFAVKLMGPESYVWRLKRTMAEVEAFLGGLSDILEQLEIKESAKLKVFRMFLQIYSKLANDEEFLKCCALHEQAEMGYLLDGDEDKFVAEVARIDSAWRNPEGREPREDSKGLVTVMTTFKRETLGWAARFAEDGIRLRRQTQITEFFPVVGN